MRPLTGIPTATRVPKRRLHLPDNYCRETYPMAVDVEPQSQLVSTLQCRSIGVNSLHYQAVKDVAPGLIVTAKAPDGIGDGRESPPHHFIVAVQFHPEELHWTDERIQRLFNTLVRASATEATDG